MKYVILMMTISLTACVTPVSVEPAFKDIQRNPPDLSGPSADALEANDPQFVDWVVETRKKCKEFGCV